MFGRHGSCTLGQFINPESVIVSQRGWLIVSDGHNDRVVILDQAGTWLLTINGNFCGSNALRGLTLECQIYRDVHDSTARNID